MLAAMIGRATVMPLMTARFFAKLIRFGNGFFLRVIWGAIVGLKKSTMRKPQRLAAFVTAGTSRFPLRLPVIFSIGRLRWS